MIKRFILVSSEGNFKKFKSVASIYKSYNITRGYIRNTSTGENLGNRVLLYCGHYDHAGMYHDELLYDEDCYEYVFDV